MPCPHKQSYETAKIRVVRYNTVAPRCNEIPYTGTSLLGINLVGIYTPALTQTDLAMGNFFRNLAAANGGSRRDLNSWLSL